jgi:hypothetical protein
MGGWRSGFHTFISGDIKKRESKRCVKSNTKKLHQPVKLFYLAK